MRILYVTKPLMYGNDVKTVQRLLKKYGHDLKVDGDFGQRSADACVEQKYRFGYPEKRLIPTCGDTLVGYLKGEKLPADYKRRATARKKAEQDIVKPLPTHMGENSEFTYVDREGAPDNSGTRHHAGKDWFAPGGTKLVSPAKGLVVEVRASRGSFGQVFGGTVKVKADNTKRIHVFRHVEPACRQGQVVKAGQKIATVTRWGSWPSGSHAHCEIWKTLEGGYDFENMIDPVKVYGPARRIYD